MPSTPRILWSNAVSCGSGIANASWFETDAGLIPERLEIIARHICGAGKAGQLGPIFRLQPEFGSELRINQCGIGAVFDQEIKRSAIIDGNADHHQITGNGANTKMSVGVRVRRVGRGET